MRAIIVKDKSGSEVFVTVDGVAVSVDLCGTTVTDFTPASARRLANALLRAADAAKERK